jgi:ornithine carbamoyltransferase
MQTSLNPPMTAPRHFLTGEELSPQEVLGLVERARELKGARATGAEEDALKGLTVALYFERPSTRTRISFQVGVAELGGHPLPLRADELQLGRGESIGDTARMLSRFVAGVVIRSGSDETVLELAEHSEVPVINGLTPLHHPCQALADLMTLAERFEKLDGLRVAYVGDGNNVARSLAILGAMVGVEVVVASPEGYRLEDGVAALETGDPMEAAEGAHALYTDVWVSMGDEASAEERRAALRPFQLREELMNVAADDAIVLHCLPAHPGEEITEGLLYGERSAVWDQAENRLHAQKALLELLLAR